MCTPLPARPSGPLAAALMLAAGLAAPASSRGDEPEDGRKYLLERIDDAAVVQVYADGFERLPLDQKILTYHLYRAAVSGRDIYYDQRYAHSLDMRDTLEAILTHPEGVDPGTLEAVRRYTKLFWINSGPFHDLTSRKFVPGCSPEQFAAAARAAAEAGAEFPTRRGETLEGLLGRLERPFFDPAFEPIVTNKSPGPGKDILAESANNLYVGVTTADLEGFEERYPLNSRLVKRDGGLVEEPYRVGGRYSAQITQIVEHLNDAIAVAPEPTARALRALVKFFRTGATEDRVAYDIAWVEDKDAPVDTINGFIEVYMDPRGVKGSFEAAVFYVNEEKTGDIKKLAEAAQWFEDHMPSDPAYRKPNVTGITANAIEVVVETGDAGPVTPIGINLPNDQDVRERHGSKSVSLSNIILAYDRSTPGTLRQEFAWTEQEAERAATWGGLAQELLVNMHEVIGHASGRQKEGFRGQPQDAIKEYYSALEEGRADLVALYFIADSKVVELGLVGEADHRDLVLAAYENYARNGGLVQLRRVREGDQIEEDHMRNRQMIVSWLLANTEAVERRSREGKTYVVMTDADAFRAGVGRLLAEVQRIKSEGDYEAAKELFEAHGIRFDPELRDEVLSRVERLDLPAYTGFVMPKLEPVIEGGEIADVKISYPLDLEAQMLEFSAAGRDARRAAPR